MASKRQICVCVIAHIWLYKHSHNVIYLYTYVYKFMFNIFEVNANKHFSEVVEIHMNVNRNIFDLTQYIRKRKPYICTYIHIYIFMLMCINVLVSTYTFYLHFHFTNIIIYDVHYSVVVGT